MMRYLFQRVFGSIWKAALTGFCLGSIGTVFLLMMEKLSTPKSGHFFPLIGLVVSIPELVIFSLLGLRNTEAEEKLLLRFGWFLPVLINGLLACTVFILLSIISKAAFKLKKRSSV